MVLRRKNIEVFTRVIDGKIIFLEVWSVYLSMLRPKSHCTQLDEVQGRDSEGSEGLT